MMKILHINAVRFGSTGRTVSDLKKYISEKNGKYRIAFSVMDSRPLDDDILIGNKFDHKIHAVLSRLLGLQGYFSYFATKRFLKNVDEYNPDIIVLSNLHSNYINLPLLFGYLSKRKIPVVMILHDCWIFTGKCTHFTAVSCDKWKCLCERCPLLRADNPSWFFDFTRKMYKDKKRWFENLEHLTVVAVSDWEKSLAIQSPLFRKAEVTRIYNWVDTDIFEHATQGEIDSVKLKYGLRSDIKYLITVGAGWTSTSTKTRDVINLASKLPSNYRLIVIGYCEKNTFPSSVKHIQYTSNPKELSALYSASVAYLHFSVEDTFGKVIAEAMSCEVVPIVFNSTACGETASPYGIAVTQHDTQAMLDAIIKAEENERRISVRQYALQNYSKHTNIELYENKFKQILSHE